MKHFHRNLLLATFLPFCWLAMQVVHEGGHVVGAWLIGKRVAWVELNPLTISRTDLADGTKPLAFVWAGPIVGIAVPLLAYFATCGIGWRTRFLPRFFAGFCLLANGLYIGVGAFGSIGDAGDLLMAGAPIWSLWLFGAVTAPAGLFLWHGLGPRFGIGRDADDVEPRVAYSSALLLVLLFSVQFALTAVGGRIPD